MRVIVRKALRQVARNGDQPQRRNKGVPFCGIDLPLRNPNPPRPRKDRGERCGCGGNPRLGFIGCDEAGKPRLGAAAVAVRVVAIARPPLFLRFLFLSPMRLSPYSILLNAKTHGER
ncbi:hypothetical protein Cni_G12920 [Canna indica]|uniref:Uncharacterized protein n=1 Tax=Canna indica TaxID=4628 RepID=A0AAQ3QB24_9LILI|nr:hypothetical protein Cni_G12920 [Canna indica]